MNRIFFAMVAIAFGAAATQQLVHDFVDPASWPFPIAEQSPMDALTAGAMDAAVASVGLAIELIGIMAFFLGLMKVAEEGGLLRVIARLLRPLMVRLFPDVPPDHPAMGAMILNMSANALGLGNAATPFGIRAMQELDKLNTRRGTATNAMALFLAINTSAVTLIPTTVIGIREAAGSTNSAAILATTLFASVCSTSVAIAVCLGLQRFSPLGPETDEVIEPAEEIEDHGAYPLWVSLLVLILGLSTIPVLIVWGTTLTPWILPVLIVGLLGYGQAVGVAVYEQFVEGAKQGFEVGVKIIPYLVAILGAVGMIRASGALDAFVAVIGPLTAPLGMPAEALPMALIRPLSGSGALGIVMETVNTHGPDSYVGFLVSTMEGSTETTFYTIAVYFGAVQVQRIRHTMAAALTADFAGVVGATVAVAIYWQLNVV